MKPGFANCGLGFFIHMSFITPKYSRKKVNKAGLLLANSDSISPEEFEWASSVLANWRTAHGHPINTFQATLRDRLKRIDDNAIVAQRLKRAPAIVEKLKRFDGMKLARMQDIGGLRAIVGSVKQVRRLEQLYRFGRFKHQLVDVDDYIDEPKKDGYRSLHMVFRYHSDIAPEYNGLNVELQLRTNQQHAWATAVETMGTYLGQSIKAGGGDADWREFFELTGAGLAFLEGTPLPIKYRDIPPRDIFDMIYGLETELGVLRKLKSFSIATDQISKIRGAYHLLVLDSKSMALSIKPFSKDKLEQAVDELKSIESGLEKGGDIEAVIVSAGPVSDLNRAYPNYFLDTHAFIRVVQNMIRRTRSPERLIASRKPQAKTRYLDEQDAKTPQFNPGSLICSRDIPQADEMDSVRNVLDAIEHGAATIQDIAEMTGYSHRHVNYKILAAEILGCIVSCRTKEITPAGRAWLNRERGGEEEARFLRGLIEDTKFYKIVVPDLFDVNAPSKEAIANRIYSLTKVTRSTAERRASALVAWSVQLRQGVLRLNSKR